MIESLDDFFVAIGGDERFSLTVGSLMYVTDPQDGRRAELERTFENTYLDEVRERNQGVSMEEMDEHIGRALMEIDRFLPRAVNALRRFYRDRLHDQNLMPPPPGQNALDPNGQRVSSSSEPLELSDGYGTDFAFNKHGELDLPDDEDYESDEKSMHELGPEARKRQMRKQTAQKSTTQTRRTGTSRMTLRSAKRGLKEETGSDAEIPLKRRRLATKPALKMETGPKLKRKMASDSSETSPEVRKKVVKPGRQELEYDSDDSGEDVSEEAFRRLAERITDPTAQARRFLKFFKLKKSLLSRQESSSSSDGQGGRYPARSRRAGFPAKKTTRLSRIDTFMDKKDAPYGGKFDREGDVPEFLAEDDSNQPSTSGPYCLPVSDDDEPRTRRQANRPSTSGPYRLPVLDDDEPETSGQTHNQQEDEDEEMESDH